MTAMDEFDRLGREAQGRYGATAFVLLCASRPSSRGWRLLEEAYQLEVAAAVLVFDGLEPTRSLLYRSAASIARMAGRFDDVRRLVVEGLRGAPSEIADELRALLP